MSGERLIATFIRCQIGDDKFQTGDGYLMGCDVLLAQNERASTCSFTLDDPDLKWAAKYLEISQKSGGIQGLPQPVSPVTSNNLTATGNLSPNMKAFLDVIGQGEVTNKGYNVRYGGGTFSDYSKHPGGGPAGRYQFIPSTWANLGMPDFTPKSQDAGAVKLIGQLGSTNLIEQGHFEDAVATLRLTWTSLPGGAESQWKSMAEAKQYWLKQVKRYQGQVTPQQAAQATQNPTATEEPKVTQTQKGRLIKIELAFGPDQELYEFEFIHTSTKSDQSFQTTFSGQSIRWVLNRRKKNATYRNITLKQLALSVARGHGLTLKYDAPEVKFSYLDQSGITDYQLLWRECQWAGLRLTEKGGLLIIAKPQGTSSGFTLQYGESVDQWTFEDKALADLQDIQSTASQPTQSSVKSEPKFEINPVSGLMSQVLKESTVSKGKEGVTGAAQRPPTGTQVDPSTATDQRARTKRVKGLPSTITFATTPEALRLEPDQSVVTEGFPGQFSRAWVVDSVRHTFSGGTLRTTLNIFSPMAAPDTSPGTQSASSNFPQSGGWQWPIQGTSCGPTCEFGYARGRLHAGVDCGGYGPDTVYAPTSGIVTVAQTGNEPGYGNWIEIKRADGWSARLAHLASVGVRVGQQVQIGQPVGVRGNTGGNYQVHLHFECRNPQGTAVNPRTILPKAGAPPIVG